MDIDWEPYLRQCNSIDAKWLLLKNRLVEGIEKFVPKISKFYEWRKPSWKNPLPRMYERNLDTNIGYGIDILKLGI